MSVRVMRYFLASIVFLSLFFLVSNIVTANCYVYLTSCSQTQPNGCNAAALSTGDCTNYADTAVNPPNTCAKGITDVCTTGCCCDGSNAYPGKLQGVCVGAGKQFFPGLSISQCTTAQCNSVPANSKFNITGYVKKNNLNIPGATIALDAGTQSTTTATTDASGAYTFTNILVGSHSLSTNYDSCTITQTISLISNVSQNLILICPNVKVSGHVKDPSGNVISNTVVNATFNGVTLGTTTDATGYYQFQNIPYNSRIDVLGNTTISGKTCTGTNGANVARNDVVLDISLSCQSYSIIVSAGSDMTGFSNPTVTVRGQIQNGVSTVFNNLAAGPFTASATWSSTGVNSAITCSNSTTGVLSGDTSVSLWLGLSNCCNITTTTSPCSGGMQSITKTYVGTCAKTSEVTTQVCNSRPPCDWICGDWASCANGAIQQTRTCPTKNDTGNCDMSLPTPPPQLVKSCTSTANCGNGILDAGSAEDCDYNAYTQVYDVNQACINTWKNVNGITLNSISDVTPDILTSICNLNTCKCIAPLTIPTVPACVQNSGNISSLTISPVQNQSAFNLAWMMSSGFCADYVDHFTLAICNNKTGECSSGIYSMINDSIKNTTRSYYHNGSLDPKIQPETMYCYNLTVVFNDNVAPENRTRSVQTCYTSGNQTCLNPHLVGWCGGDSKNDKYTCNQNNLLSIVKCAPDTCSVINGNATCIKQAPCDKCNGILGLFGYQGYEIKTTTPIPSTSRTFTVLCPSVSQPAPTEDNTGKSSGDYLFGCYRDYSLTSVDQAYSCNNVATCYDYQSESACTQDYCNKFNVTGTNNCMWKTYSDTAYKNVFGKGVCIPKNESEQRCDLCANPKYNRLGLCVGSTCNMFGKCYFSYDNSNCMNTGDVTCDTYKTESTCTGINNVSVSVDVQWNSIGNNENNGGKKISGTNRVITRSNDGGAGIIGLCKWLPDEDKCVRDADNSTYLYEDDCRIHDISLRNKCQKDIAAPNTTINNKSVYGLTMDLMNQVRVTDNNPWAIGDMNSYSAGDWAKIRTFYCVVNDTNSCYPNKVLSVTGDDPYKIDLSDLGFGKGDDGKTLTMYYFSEDPARNLESIKNFRFTIDALEPNVAVSMINDSYQISDSQWLTNLNVTLQLQNVPTETSLPVTCSFKIIPISDGAVVAFGGRRAFNIPLMTNPSKNKLDYTNRTLNTSYPSLVDGEYLYELNCTDTLGNQYDDGKFFNITGNILIQSPTPFGDKYVNAQIQPKLAEMSINTSTFAVCRYSDNFSKTYPDMNQFISNAGGIKHNTTINIPTITGVYKYYVMCNMSINGNYKLIKGDDMDDPYFSVDNDAPITKLAFKNPDNNYKWAVYNATTNKTYETLTIGLICNDSTPTLTMAAGKSMAFGCNETMYYCIETGSDKCVDSAAYGTINSTENITFDYSVTNSPDKQKYENNPVVHYYSKDLGGNAAGVMVTKLKLRNMQLEDPNITILLGARGAIANPGETINNSYITILLNYTDEKNVNISSIVLQHVTKNIPVQLEYLDETSGQSEYRFRRTYLENGRYKLTINATDDDGNVNNNVTYLIVSHSNNSIILVEPIVGIGSAPKYNITLATDYYSSCAYHAGDPINYCPNKACKYGLYTPLTTTGLGEHRFEYDSTSIGIRDMYIVCKTLNSLDDNSDDSYVNTTFKVGYNDTIPTMRITFVQNPKTRPEDNRIINASYNATIIRVNTSQPSVCQINKTIDMINHPDQQLIEIAPPDFFGNENNFVYNTYGTIHDYLINYTDRNIYEGVFDYTINCTTLAQVSMMNTTWINFTTNTAPPSVSVSLNLSQLTLNRYSVSCSGFCNDIYQTTYQYAIINQTDSCSGVSAWTTKNYTQLIEVKATQGSVSKTICVRVYDVLGRIGTANLTVDMPGFNNGKMDINYPYSYYYDADARNKGVKDQLYSPTKTFTLNITTPVNATCRYIKQDFVIDSDARSKNYDNIYSYSLLFDNTTSDTMNASTHTTRITIASIANHAEVWAVICRTDNTGTADPYIRRALYLYWDDNAPTVTANLTPPKIYDWSVRRTEKIELTTNDDAACMLNLSKSYVMVNTSGTVTTEKLNTLYNTPDTVLLDTDNATDLEMFDTYNTYRTYTYELPSKWISSLDNNATYNLSMSCWNRALLGTEKNITLLYDLEHSVKINRTSGFAFNGTSIPVALITNIISQCSAAIDGITYGTLTTTDGIHHNSSLTVARGYHNINITCVVPTNTDILAGYENYVAMTDNEIPTVNLSSTTGKDYVCGLDGFNINVDMDDDTGIDGYSYTISGPGVSQTNYTTSGTHSVLRYNGTLTDIAAYTVTVKAKDIVGKYSASKNIVITARNPPTSILCDRVNPTISITSVSTPFLDMIKTTVSCTDDTGCNPIYGYTFTNNTGCDNLTYSASRAYSDQLTFMRSGLLCVKGQDIAGNAGYGQFYVNISIDTSNPLNITPNNTAGNSPGLFNYIYPNVIVTNITPLNITLTTALSATCAYSLTPTANNNISSLYSTYRVFDSTGATTHNIYNFDTRNIYETYMDVICYSTQLTQPYSRKILRIIYDTTNPSINATIRPEVVYDWNRRKSILRIHTIPETVCSILGNDNQNTPYMTGNYTDALTYTTDQTKEMVYDQSTLSPTIFNYTINCRSFGNNLNSTTLNLKYNINNTLGIQLLSPTTFSTMTVELLIETNLISDCTIYWNNVSKGGMIANITGRQHYIKFNASGNGTYTAEFRCITPITGIQNSSSYAIIINTSKPRMYCGDGIVQNPNDNAKAEQCDGNDLGGRSCTSPFAGYNFTGGALKCKSDCTYDFTSCDSGNGWCGDGRISHPNSASFDEQCDDNGAGVFPASRNCVDLNANFKGGLLFCNNCIINTSRCLMDNGQVLSVGSQPTCSNKILESGEQCEVGQVFTIGCTYFGYSGGTIGCTNTCSYDRTGCYVNTTQPPSGGGNICGNGILNTGEKCDGTRGLDNVSCSQLGNYIGGTVSCTKQCTYNLSKCVSTVNHCKNGVKDLSEADTDCGGKDCAPCGLNLTCFDNSDCASNKCSGAKCIANPCNNTVFDNAFETDIDCGNTCKTCAVGKNCTKSSDCDSGYCTNGKCAANPCNNGIKDLGEVDTDCGGSCALCDAGKNCVTNADCSTDNCVNGICKEKSSEDNTAEMKLILMIIGILFILGGGGYIAYKTFAEKGSSGRPPMIGGFGSRPGLDMPPKPTILTPEQKKLIEKQREAMMKKRQERSEERKGLLQSLDSDSKKDTSKERKEDKDELKKIALKGDESEEFIDISEIKSKQKGAKETLLATKADKEDAFKKLSDIKIDDVAKKIAKLSGTNKEDITPALTRNNNINHEDALKMFGKLDREMIMSNVFREILSKLLSSGKITKENVSNILFEYMDKGLLSKGDVAKIGSDLKII